MNNLTQGQPAFVVTKEYRRFVEFCEACRRYQYIGICHGLPGVGKTWSARHYARWDELGPLVESDGFNPTLPNHVHECHAVVYTPTVTTNPSQLARALYLLCSRFADLVEHAVSQHEQRKPRVLPPACTDLIIVDEADRLKMAGLEQLRDIYDRQQLGLILIGMPGLEKRLARYPQLYSRVGFVHTFRPLSQEELQFILNQKWTSFGKALDMDDFTDAEAVAAIARITSGNLRLLHRLFTQIERIMEINHLQTLTKEVVEAAREGLVTGPL